MPRGIAIKYHLPGGADTDMVTNSFKFFPVATGEDFRDLLTAITQSPPDAPHPNKLEQFFGSHPNAPKALGTLAVPDSFADEEYHGIDAFIFVGKSGQRQAVRYPSGAGKSGAHHGGGGCQAVVKLPVRRSEQAARRKSR